MGTNWGKSRAWSIGCLIIILFVVLGELTVVFHDYSFSRLGLERNTVLYVLWLLPLVASFIAARYSQVHGIVFALSYAIILPASGALGHYINGVLGGGQRFCGHLGGISYLQGVFFNWGHPHHDRRALRSDFFDQETLVEIHVSKVTLSGSMEA